MKTFMMKLLLSSVAASGLVSAAIPGDPKAASKSPEQQLVHEIRLYPRYSIWDNIKIRVEDGSVELLGQVNEPYKKADLQRIAARVPGVTNVVNDIQVLPLSPFDNRLRVQVARAIYRDPVLSRYGLQSLPPIHIIVDNGHVALEGVVSTELERNVAGIRASGAGLSFGPVINHLRVENPKPVS